MTMRTVEVSTYVDVDLDDFSDSELTAELARRRGARDQAADMIGDNMDHTARLVLAIETAISALDRGDRIGAREELELALLGQRTPASTNIDLARSGRHPFLTMRPSA